LAVLALFVGASASTVTPIDKVISLIEGLKTEVETEGAAEAKAYESFACFCKRTSGAKSKSVQKGNDNIGSLSSDIADKTQSKKDDSTELGERKVKQEKLSKDLDDTKARCAQEKATYEAEEADQSKAISSLKGAIKSMTDSKPSAASLLAIKSVIQKLSSMSVVTESSASTQKRVVALAKQKVDPNDPEYGFHSNDIIDLCQDLLGEFKASKKDLDSEWEKTNKGCIATKSSLRKDMQSNDGAMNNLDKSIARLGTEIAKHREDLVEAEGDMKDDELHLTGLAINAVQHS
jgi:predicted  nucleic acid-binding Zn-ribbon protein